MQRNASVWPVVASGYRLPMAAGLLAASLLLVGGCFSPQKTRAQMEEEDREKILKVDTIGEATTVGNVAPLQVQGVGLVTGLDHTGGGAPPGSLRKMLEDELRRLKLPNVKQLLDSDETAMVIVTGLILPGTRRMESFDVQVSLPPGSKVKSLRGGYLQQCYLRIWDTKSHLAPNSKKPDGVLQGQQVAKAGGRLVVGLNDAGGKGPNELVGELWEGGVSFIDRPYYFILNSDKQFPAKLVNAIATRINGMYQDDPKKQLDVARLKNAMVLDEISRQVNEKFNQMSMSGHDTAKAVNKQTIVVNVPLEYRHNTQRFMMVARQVPLAEPRDRREAYRKCLNTMLLDPAQTLRAAVRLEALGKESIPALKSGLEHKHPLVRFASAEALAYLGDRSGVPILAEYARDYFALRAFCLTALASLDHAESREVLTELMANDKTETRYGAFRALQLLGGGDAVAYGEVVGHNAFRLHRLAPQSAGLVHYTSTRRAEVVLFGRTPCLVPPVQILTANKEFTITAARDDRLCTITRTVINRGTKVPEQCSLQLDDVLKTLAEMGAEYPEVVDFLRQADAAKCLNCPVCHDAMPQAPKVDDLAKSALKAGEWGSAAAANAPAHYRTAVSAQ